MRPMAHVMFHMSHVTCHMSHVTCPMSCVFFLIFFLQFHEICRLKVCYQRGLTRLVLKKGLCIIHTIHGIFHIALSTLHTALCTLHTAHCTLHIKLHTSHFAHIAHWYDTHCILNSLHNCLSQPSIKPIP